MRDLGKTCARLAVIAAMAVAAAMVLSAQAPAGRGRGPNTGGAGADDKHVVDPAASDRGKKVYAAECINCHGTHARGTDNGADLIRSVVVLHDRYGSTIGPFLRKGHPTQTTPPANLTQAQIEDGSNGLWQRRPLVFRGR